MKLKEWVAAAVGAIIGGVSLPMSVQFIFPSQDAPRMIRQEQFNIHGDNIASVSGGDDATLLIYALIGALIGVVVVLRLLRLLTSITNPSSGS